MIDRLIRFIRCLFRQQTYSLMIVRRYTDANGSYVGELYLLGTFAGMLVYQMIGVSLDSLPIDASLPNVFDLDIENDFLAPMPPDCVRVGAYDPRDNDAVRSHIAELAKSGRIDLRVQNRFIEHVLQRKP
jgi:hypothetical protein